MSGKTVFKKIAKHNVICLIVWTVDTGIVTIAAAIQKIVLRSGEARAFAVGGL